MTYRITKTCHTHKRTDPLNEETFAFRNNAVTKLREMRSNIVDVETNTIETSASGYDYFTYTNESGSTYTLQIEKI